MGRRARRRRIGFGRIALFRDISSRFRRRFCRRLAGLLGFQILGKRRNDCQRNNGQSTDQDRENLLFRFAHFETSFR